MTIRRSEYVRFLYRLLLQRDADPAGLAHWVATLEAGCSLDEVFEAIRHSDEFARVARPGRVRTPAAAEHHVAAAGPSSIYFFHIPKTGGISVQRYLERVLGPERLCPAWSWDELTEMPADEVARYRVFRGHFQGYLIDYLRRPWTLLTLLRDPVERSLSCYFYARSNPNYPFHAPATAMTLKEYCLHPVTRWRIENYQTACLLTLLWRSSEGFAADCRATAGPDFATHRAIEQTTAAAVPASVRAELAILALPKFAAVGITEHLRDSLDLFSRTLGVSCIDGVIRENTSPNRPDAAEIDADTLRMIEALTEADRRVYDFARAAFNATRPTAPTTAPGARAAADCRS